MLNYQRVIQPNGLDIFGRSCSNRHMFVCKICQTKVSHDCHAINSRWFLFCHGGIPFIIHFSLGFSNKPASGRGVPVVPDENMGFICGFQDRFNGICHGIEFIQS